ncbi:mitochondrial antiviral-signaling protein [Pseudonaja textilis]|uniref:mitochondrial antiviral-signaling protein n=1 Tax=Pseudonaja textilis TaxID=8673 RepID=UPI000EA8D18E|nr:mitochondrial antiviral-signaling protein [Pseudonaja textilis]
MSDRGKELAEGEVKKYIYHNLAMFHRVQVNQMIHLKCFTETDRQKIRASYTNEGNNETTFLFFQLLCCREGWVMYFIKALREQQMGDLADKLECVYRSKLLPPRTPPAPSAPPAANRPSAPPLRPDVSDLSPGNFEAQALPWSPSRLTASSANLPPQNMGDYRTPIQENSHPTPDSGANPGLPSISDTSSASNIRAAVRGDGAIASPDPYPVEVSESVPGPVEERPLHSLRISNSAAGSMEKNWDGRQHHPVTVKNGCFGNPRRPEDSGTGSALPTGACDNQPEEDYYSSDSVPFALTNPREDSATDRKIHVLRGDRKQENPPVVPSLQTRLDAPRKNFPASRGSPENQPQLFRDPPANGAQPSLKPLLPVADPERRLPSHSSVERKLPKPRSDVSAAGGDGPSRDVKLPVEEKMEETTGTGGLAGRSEWGMEPRSSAVRDRKRDGRIFDSNCSEDDLPPKPGILSSDLAAEPSKLSSGDAGETPGMYSGSSERLRMSTSGSDPILISENSSAGHSIASITGASVAVGATLPPEVGTDEEDTSFRSHHLLVEKNPSMDLMEVPKDGASSRRSPRAFPDSTSDGQPSNEAKDPQAGPSLPEKKVEFEEAATSGDFRMVVLGLALAALASAAFVLYKKK